MPISGQLGSGGGGGDATAANQSLQITQETAINTVLGAQADASATTDSGTFSITSLVKRLLGKFATQFPAALTVGGNLKVANQEALPAGTNVIGEVVASENSNVIDVTLSLDTAIYADGDVLADTQELAGAVRVNAGTGEVRSIVVTDKDDQGQPFDIWFLKTNVSLGTENSAPNISDTNAVEVLGRAQIFSGDYYDLGGVKSAIVDFSPFMVKAGTGSTSIYVAAISRGTGTYTASGLILKIGIARF